MTDAPVHLLLGPPEHGVRVHARMLAARLGAPVATDWSDAAGHDRVHVHLTDRLARPDDVSALARGSQVTVTLHDLPQPSDGTAFPRRREAYRDLLNAVDGWAVGSQHERALVREHLDPRADGLVTPLPVITRSAVSTPGAGAAKDDLPDDWPQGPTAAVFGFVYPGKGHAEVIAAAATLPGRPPVTVLALGAAAPGHDDLPAALARQAAAAGVAFGVTGHLSDTATTAALRRVDVGVCGHRNVSASASMNDWVGAGRRPLVRTGRYAEEMVALRPGCYRTYADDGLAACLRAALATAESTWIDPDVETGPHLDDTARSYRDWWRSR